MAKYCGFIGFAETVEESPGIWTEKITEKKYIGDIVKRSVKNTNNEINTNFTISNNISIISNSYLDNNLGKMKYITFMGSKWLISDIQVSKPRINISVGGLYNG